MASLSPNRRPRTNDERVRLIVLHATYMASDDEAIARLCDPSTEVSCHYYLKRSGEVVQLVEDSDVAWHAGKSRWVFPTGEEIEGLNGHSLGIEIGNAGPFAAGVPTPAQEQTPDWAKAEPFTEAQYTALAALLKTLMQRHGLKLEAIVGHSQIAPGRKSDPGPHFDWVKLHALLLA
jgi:N-acetylmuramoyl-L-alanine amidase